MFGKTMKKLLSFAMAAAMTVNLLPLTAFANEPEYVYISASHDGQFITGQNGALLAHTAVPLTELAAIDLADYNLSDYAYDADGDGSGDITALHLYIYTHEVLYGGDWSNVTIAGGAGSIYFAGGLFGFEDENLRYNYNGAYPADENGWGFTADRIVLSEGDYFDVAHFSDWNFYADSAYGFHYFTDDNGEITHSFTAEAGEAVSVNLTLVGGGMGMGDTTTAEVGYTVYYGNSIGTATGSVTTDDNGNAQIRFNDAGTYYIWCDGGEGVDSAAGAIVSSPASATVTVTAAEEEPAPETPRTAQDVSAVLDATMAQLAETVTAPAFGTNAGEWTVLSLARGGYYEKDNAYFTDYYDRIVETVNTTAASVNLNGALHKNKSTDNSRLIVALSAIGKDARSVGDWDLVEAYSANGFSWIKKQGINGSIWALIALDSNNYETSDETIRQQCVDSILSLQLEDGGWALSGTVSDPDVSGMALTALYPYRNQTAVAEACEEAFACLSAMQHENGSFASGGSECSESCAWVMVSTTTWGINPDTDSRFIKNGKSVVDALLTHYLEEEEMFQHIVGAGANGMATDQSCYALVAYDRLLNSQPALYDYSDVVFDERSEEMKVTLSMPEKVEAKVGTEFKAQLLVNKWDNEANYKLIDILLDVPKGVSLKEEDGVVAAQRLKGGQLSYHLETPEEGDEESSTKQKLRIVYFDPEEKSSLTVDGTDQPIELFEISLVVNEDVSAVVAATAEDEVPMFDFAVSGMSIKLSSDSSDENAMIIVNSDKASAQVQIVTGLSYCAVQLYVGDDVDLIPSTKQAVAVAVTGIDDEAKGAKLLYKDETNEIAFQYSEEITKKTGISTYVALVDAAIPTENFGTYENMTITLEEKAAALTFGDSNADGVINAQDALAAVDFWLRKEVPTDDDILAMNINGDSRLNTFDALGIVEAFVDGREYQVVTKAATTSNPPAVEDSTSSDDETK